MFKIIPEGSRSALLRVINSVRPAIVSGLNLLLIVTSWIFYRYPQGDEYLVLFMIPLVFIIAPFMVTLPVTAVLFSANLIFFIFYYFAGVLDVIDVFVLTLLLGGVTAGSYLVKSLYTSFALYYNSDVSEKRDRYSSIINELEVIDRRGRKRESELSRVSRLYEITKKLGPALEFKTLFDALFDFLEENFRFQTAHLLVFSKGKFHRGISKSVGDEDYSKDTEKILDYEKVANYARERDLKPFFAARDETGYLFDSMKVRADTFMLFPLFMGDKLCAILAVEGISKSSYGRFRILIPQILLEFRKVELYEQVQELSIIDGLTGAYLRRYLMSRLEEEVDRADRLGLTFSIGMIDVDHFKECNDRHGHLVGDAVLKRISERLKSSVREVDMVARYGGEEFCMVLPETTRELALTVAERLRRSIESREIKAFDESIRITVSVGIATYPEDGKDVDTLIEKADTALYRAKRKGRNAVCTV
ncbi:MAG: hypothetical protein DRP85_01505 [Candidatus Makaraimicrobium thalassicum]|nr:MAG: hypothetical protein DRP85_01505 [Candidatus Omnitrophota bacterium]